MRFVVYTAVTACILSTMAHADPKVVACNAGLVEFRNIKTSSCLVEVTQGSMGQSMPSVVVTCGTEKIIAQNCDLTNPSLYKQTLTSFIGAAVDAGYKILRLKEDEKARDPGFSILLSK